MSTATTPTPLDFTAENAEIAEKRRRGFTTDHTETTDTTDGRRSDWV